MGCDISAYLEVRDKDGRWSLVRDVSPEEDEDWVRDEVFPFYRNYGVFGFLADVRNYSRCPVIAPPRGVPDDMSPELRELHWEGSCGHGYSWLTIAELLAYDYDQTFEDRRTVKFTPPGTYDNAALADEGEGERVTMREFIGEWFLDRVQELTKFGDPADVRLVYWFDS